MKQSTAFILQVIVSMAFIMGVLGYTAAVSSAFVSPQLVLKVIQTGGGK